MKETTIEINEYQLVIYRTIRALYENYSSDALIYYRKLKNFVNSLGIIYNMMLKNVKKNIFL